MARIVNMRRDPKNRNPCWLVWSMQTSGLTQLRAIDTNGSTALKHAKACRGENEVIRAWAEERDMDHLYGHADVTQYQITNRKELIRVAAELSGV